MLHHLLAAMSDQVGWIAFVLAAGIGLFFILRARPIRRPRAKGTYSQRKTILSEAEVRLLGVLRTAAPRQFIFGKTGLADVVSSSRTGGNSQLAAHTVDFVILERRTTRPLCAVLVHNPEQPRSHGSQEFTQHVLEAAGIPVVVMNIQHWYDEADVAERIAAAIAESQQLEGAQEQVVVGVG